MSIEAGWYYAEGDPPGTVRRWNGVEWIGFPTIQPTAEGTTPGNAVGVKPFVYPRGMVGLKGIAIVVQLCLLLVMVASAVHGVTLLQIAPYTADLMSSGGEFSDQLPDGLAVRWLVASLATQLLTLGTGIFFVIWFVLAYRNMGLWHRNRRGTPWAFFAWIVPFIQFIRPMTMMLELAENSARPDRSEDLSPTPVIAWWILWVFAQFGVLLFAFGGGINDVAANFLTGQGILALLGAVAAGIAIYIVQGITDAQEGRRHPTAAQREMMRQQAQVAAVHQSQSTGILPS